MSSSYSSGNGDVVTLPSGWVATTMGALGDLLCGTSPPSGEVNTEGNGVPYVTGPEQWDGTTLHLNKWTTAARRTVPDGCIFITVKGAGVGTLFPGKAVAIGRDIYAFRPHNEISAKFVQHALQFTIQDVICHAQGDIPGLSRQHILAHPLQLPPAMEQSRIADRIDELFTDLVAGVAALERVKRKLKRYRSAVLHAAVTGRLTAGWRAARGPAEEPGAKLLERILVERRRQWEARTLAKYEKDGRTPPKNWQARYVEPTSPNTDGLPELPEGWCWASGDQLVQVLRSGSTEVPIDDLAARRILRSSAVRPGRIDLDDFRYLPDSVRVDEADYVQPNDLFFVRLSGSLHLAGACALVGGVVTANLVYPDRLFAARCVMPAMARMLEIVFQSRLARDRIEPKAKSTAGHQRISMGAVLEQAIPLPPLAEQCGVVEAVNEKLSQIDAMEAEVARGLARAARLRQAILKAAFEGKLVPQDPSDEPASVLLERIRQETARADKAPQAPRRRRRAVAGS